MQESQYGVSPMDFFTQIGEPEVIHKWFSDKSKAA